MSSTTNPNDENIAKCQPTSIAQKPQNATINARTKTTFAINIKTLSQAGNYLWAKHEALISSKQGADTQLLRTSQQKQQKQLAVNIPPHPNSKSLFHNWCSCWMLLPQWGLLIDTLTKNMAQSLFAWSERQQRDHNRINFLKQKVEATNMLMGVSFNDYYPCFLYTWLPHCFEGRGTVSSGCHWRTNRWHSPPMCVQMWEGQWARMLLL